jgi:hypothetical protein
MSAASISAACDQDLPPSADRVTQVFTGLSVKRSL